MTWYLVVDEHGLHGVYEDRGRAERAADAIGGIVLSAPVVHVSRRWAR